MSSSHGSVSAFTVLSNPAPRTRQPPGGKLEDQALPRPPRRWSSRSRAQPRRLTVRPAAKARHGIPGHRAHHRPPGNGRAIRDHGGIEAFLTTSRPPGRARRPAPSHRQGSRRARAPWHTAPDRDRVISPTLVSESHHRGLHRPRGPRAGLPLASLVRRRSCGSPPTFRATPADSGHAGGVHDVVLTVTPERRMAGTAAGGCAGSTAGG
jgi:hypothetical protein